MLKSHRIVRNLVSWLVELTPSDMGLRKWHSCFMYGNYLQWILILHTCVLLLYWIDSCPCTPFNNTSILLKGEFIILPKCFNSYCFPCSILFIHLFFLCVCVNIMGGPCFDSSVLTFCSLMTLMCFIFNGFWRKWLGLIKLHQVIVQGLLTHFVCLLKKATKNQYPVITSLIFIVLMITRSM